MAASPKPINAKPIKATMVTDWPRCDTQRHCARRQKEGDQQEIRCSGGGQNSKVGGCKQAPSGVLRKRDAGKRQPDLEARNGQCPGPIDQCDGRQKV